jgi:hypothetical protein
MQYTWKVPIHSHTEWRRVAQQCGPQNAISECTARQQRRGSARASCPQPMVVVVYSIRTFEPHR